ncbi:SprT-like domain-containing protein [Erwinia amylovora]|uniref:SprT-like domain-containing protein n=1 Tax=Erwinia amylovora TaxID=552 RepID=UPI0022AB559E|nr:SprT-like domain-containing protein [Erwinia amylovora]MCZ2719969.1 SprT-like domain-containing protein [Erwinia amylovora]
MKPTQQAYEELQVAYDHFNQTLFDGSLPTCLITLQREKKTYGYFSAERFVHADGKRTDEIAMNPAYFAVCPPEEIMQTLVHEMTHLWQYHFGKPGRGGYHNKEWASKMESIGLMPSSTGQPGGARTGDKMADYAIEGGLFMEEYNKLMQEDFRISWMDRFPARDRLLAALESGNIHQFAGDLSEMGIEVSENGEMSIKQGNKSNRIKYTCPKCETNLWGKPELNVICGDCETTFEVTG